MNCLTEFDGGAGPELCAGGDFEKANDNSTSVYNVTRLGDTGWTTVGPERTLTGPVRALVAHDDGAGEALYVGGSFESVGDLTVHRIARWDGSGWQGLGSGVNGDVDALAVYDDGSGANLYAGGSFGLAGGSAASKVARWNGVSWTALGAGMNAAARVQALAVHDDGGGPALYAGGDFTSAGGLPANRIARWNGVGWSALGSGLNDRVLALAVYDDGSGPALFAGGDFSSAGGISANRIARWNGAAWAPLESGRSSPVASLAVFDDGSGPALYAGSSFSSGDISRWDGASWTTIASGLRCNSLAVLDDGLGAGLYVGGGFLSVSGEPASMLARWDGTSWSPLGGGVNTSVNALAVFDHGNGPALFVGGDFDHAFDSHDAFLAEWGRDRAAPEIDAPDSVSAIDRIGSLPGEVVFFQVAAHDGLDATPSLSCDPPSGSFFPLGTTLVSCTATDDCGNRSTVQFPVTVAPRVRRR